ncbi:hypothetical protein D3C73_1222460 [compost metagenome]
MTIRQVLRDVGDTCQLFRTLSDLFQVRANLLFLPNCKTWVGLDFEPATPLLTLIEELYQASPYGLLIASGRQLQEFHSILAEFRVHRLFDVSLDCSV